MFPLRRLCVMCLLTFGSLGAAATTSWTQFDTRGHAKSNGVSLTLRVPSDWKAAEGNRPHVVQKFTSPDHVATIILLIQDLELPAGETVSREEMAAELTPSALRAIVPDGMRVIDAQTTKLEGLPAGLLEFDGTQQRLGVGVDTRTWQVVLFSGRSLVQVQCMVAGQSGQIDTAAAMARYRPVFLQAVNSLVLQDVWNAPASAAPAATARTTHPAVAPSPPAALPLVLTLVLGLVPPLLIRYLFARHALANGAAIGWSALLLLCNVVALAALGHRGGAVLGAVAIASFFILRAGQAAAAE